MSSIATLPVPVGWPDSLSNNVDEQVDRIKRWLELFIEKGQVTELRACEVMNFGSSNSTHTEAGFYDDMFKMARDALGVTQRAVGTYFIPNPIEPVLLASCCNRIVTAKKSGSTADNLVQKRRWLYVDIDPVKTVKTVSATDEEKSFAIATTNLVRSFLCECGWNEPIVVDSGNGRHLYYSIDLPIQDAELVHNVLKALQNRFSSPSADIDLKVANPSRIMKIPGTLARKGDQIQGRIHRRAFVLEIPSGGPKINDISLLEKVAGAANRVVELVDGNLWSPETNGVAPHVVVGGSPSSNGQQQTEVQALAKDIRAYLAKVPGAVAGQDGHGQTFHVACILTHDFSLSETEAMEYIREWNATCSPPWAEHELLHKVKDAAGKPGARGRLLRKPGLPIPGSTTTTPTTVDWKKTDRRTDVWNGQRLVLQHGQDMLYCGRWKRWLIWNSLRWVEDEAREVYQKAKQVAMSMYEEVNNAPTGLEKTQWLQWAIKSEDLRRINAMVASAADEPGMYVKPTDFDKNPFFLNCENGTIDLLSGTLRTPSRDDRMTKTCAVKYDQAATCPTWDQFLLTIFENDVEIIEFMQRVAGYSLTGDVNEQVVFFLYGTGKNGKSTYLEVIREILGDYALTADFNTFIEKEKTSVTNDVARLHGARFVSAMETGKDRKLAEALLKKMTGAEKVTARYLYSEAFEFLPVCKIFLAANHKPIIRGADLGIWRRIKMIPFEVVIPEDKRIKNMQEILLAESSGILNWMLKGLAQWRQIGLATPEKIEAATVTYQMEMDVIKRFLEDCCQNSTSAQVFADNSKLYRAYEIWCMSEGEEPMKQRAFTMSMKEHGCKQTHGNNGYRKWPNLMIKPEWLANVEAGTVAGDVADQSADGLSRFDEP